MTILWQLVERWTHVERSAWFFTIFIFLVIYRGKIQKFTFAAGNMWEEKYSEIINHNILMSHPFAKIAFRQMKWKVLPGDKITGTWNLIIAWIKRGKPNITEENQNFRNSFSSFIRLFNCRKSLFQSLDDSEITHLCFYFGKKRKVQTLTWMVPFKYIHPTYVKN